MDSLGYSGGLGRPAKSLNKFADHSLRPRCISFTAAAGKNWKPPAWIENDLTPPCSPPSGRHHESRIITGWWNRWELYPHYAKRDIIMSHTGPAFWCGIHGPWSRSWTSQAF